MTARTHILIVEDEPALADEMKAFFEAKGFQVSVANDGMYASGIVRTQAFNVIVSDIKLPGMSGLQLVVATRGTTVNKTTPMFLMTGNADEEVVRRAAQLNIAKLLIKPFKLEELFEQVSKVTTIKKPKTYDVKIINCFIEAANEVLSYYFQKPVAVGKPSVKVAPAALGYASGLISFTGTGLQGSMSISFDKPFVKELAQAVFQGSSPTMDDTMIADLSGETANQLCGKVKINFSKIGLKVSIGLPKVVLGEGHKIVHKTDRPVIMIPIAVDQLSCTLEFAMTDVDDEAIQEEKSADVPADDVMLF